MSAIPSDSDLEKFYRGFLEEINHFERPNVENFEIKTFLCRLISVFETLMTRLEFAATLPLILSNPEISEILKNRNMLEVLDAFAPFQDSQRCSSEEMSHESLQLNTGCQIMYNSDCSCSDRSTTSFKSKKEYLNAYNAIRVLMSYPEINQLSKDYQYEISNPALNFLRQIKFFIEFVISKMKLMPVEERQKELYIRELAAAIEKSKHEILEITGSLEEQKIRHLTELEELSDQLNTQLDKWKQIKAERDESFRKILDDSKNNTAKALEEYSERIERQSSVLENFKIQAENERVTHRKIEREIQGLKLKVESQLASLLTKFDTEIGERQNALEELEREFEALSNEKSQLMDEMDEQFIIYDAIIKEREAIAFEAYKEKYERFVKKRSAKIIQRWWRKILLKRKKKKGKKKKTKLK